MRFLIDNALSPEVAACLKQHGLDAVHLRDLIDPSSPDEKVFDLAAAEGRILVSANSDFGAILANRLSSKPSFILFRHGASGGVLRHQSSEGRVTAARPSS